jgi:hypothetical protein
MPVPGHLLILGQKADLLGIRVMDAAGANNFQVREARHLVQGLPGSDLIPIASDDHLFLWSPGQPSSQRHWLASKGKP